MQTDPQYKLRLPADLKEKIKQASEENHRSMNAEIVARLQESFEPPSSSDFVSMRRSNIGHVLDKESVTIDELVSVIKLFRQDAILTGEEKDK
ncbi:MAG: Arc family DNA-binding protein [Halomonas sp.]|nr:Arc family DNA-binding protein [Halomonas sp.]